MLRPQLQYLEDGLGSFLVVGLGLLHSGDEGQLLQVLQDGQSGTLLGQLLAVALALCRELPHGDAGQETFHVWGAALLQHLDGGYRMDRVEIRDPCELNFLLSLSYTRTEKREIKE